MPRAAILLTALALLGCGRAKPTAADPPEVAAPQPTPRVTAEPARPTTTPVPTPAPGPSPKVLEFREKVAGYLTEARAGAKLLTLAPSLEQVKAKAAVITDLYTRLPDVPPEVDATGVVAGKLKNINGSFAVAESFAEYRARFARGGSVEGVKKADESLAQSAENVRKVADEIEARVGLK